MQQIFASLIVCATLATAPPAIAPPQIGFVLDKSNAIRPVFGVAGSFTLGDSIGSAVVSSAFLGSFGFTKTDSAIAVFNKDGQVLYAMDAPPGPALFAGWLAYITQAKMLLRWTGISLEPVRLSVDGELLSITQPDFTHASLLLRSDDNLWLIRLSLDSGAIEAQLPIPGIYGPVLLLNDGGFVFQNPDGIVIQHPDGSQIPLAAHFSGPVRFQFMDSGWVQATEPGGVGFAIDVRPGREQIYRLPEAPE